MACWKSLCPKSGAVFKANSAPEQRIYSCGCSAWPFLVQYSEEAQKCHHRSDKRPLAQNSSHNTAGKWGRVQCLHLKTPSLNARGALGTSLISLNNPLFYLLSVDQDLSCTSLSSQTPQAGCQLSLQIQGDWFMDSTGDRALGPGEQGCFLSIPAFTEFPCNLSSLNRREARWKKKHLPKCCKPTEGSIRLAVLFDTEKASEFETHQWRPASRVSRMERTSECTSQQFLNGGREFANDSLIITELISS